MMDAGRWLLVREWGCGILDDASRFTEGTLPNGLAFAENGDILISNFGTDVLEVMTRDGQGMPCACQIS